MQIPRSEHPDPQRMRNTWLNLNGVWSYCFDPLKKGHECGYCKSSGFDESIIAPFCPESSLSGIGHTGFIPAMWYHRTFTIPDAWNGYDVILRFGAVDYFCRVFIDGNEIGSHAGGSTPFSFDITSVVKLSTKHSLVVYVEDDTQSGLQPTGKQAHTLNSQGCVYTRVTGIWQTVWLEAMPHAHIDSFHIIPVPEKGRFVLLPSFAHLAPGSTLTVTCSADGKECGKAAARASDGMPVNIDISNPQPWIPANPFLYDITLKLSSGEKTSDIVQSYAGLRKIHIEGGRIFLNNEPLYLRMVLDQGYYPDGIWTAPSDEALKNDIVLGMEAGFNGARLHQKAFEPRYHYWADRLGYLTWAESPSWGIAYENPIAQYNFSREWLSLVMRDRNHPSIIAWTPLNETYEQKDMNSYGRFVRYLYDATKAIDPIRPVNDASGGTHIQTDLYTVHTYEQNPARLKQQLVPDNEKGLYYHSSGFDMFYTGQPYLVDEFGGIKWVPAGSAGSKDAWGYGNAPSTIEEFYVRLEGLVEALLSHSHIAGYCYTQLTDVEQETNGVYTYDRGAKFDIKKIRKFFSGR